MEPLDTSEPIDTSEADPPEGTVGGHGDNVDEEILSELFTLTGDGSSDGLIRVFDLFQKGVPTRLADAERALAEGRLDDVGHIAHSLRGSAGAFGARRLCRLGEQLEQASGQADTSEAVSLLAEMRAEFLVFHAMLTSRLALLTST